ncbi:unnamed protein product [Symbiodinium sp. CCMP2456]|nr:unnamed protein product [Symbiodinium sp. CCMP2456]
MSAVAADGSMPLMELHAVHFGSQGLVPLRAEDLAPGGAGASALLSEALARASAHELDRPEGAESVQVTAVFTGRLTFLARGQMNEDPLLQLPLLMAHVSATPVDDASALLALVLPSSSASTEAWVMRVYGREPELQAVLGLLSKSGVIRHDLSATYVIGPLLAKGGFSSVFRAQQHDPSSAGQRKVAFKVVPMADGALQRQMRKEVELQLLCHEHQNIVKLVSIFQADGQQFADDRRPCWAMALSLAGQGDLFDWVHCGGTVSENFAASIMQGLLAALRHIHLQGVCHRDVKPENVLVSNSRPLLCDFGVATRLSEVRKRPIHCGPAGFTAPEILLNMEPTTQSDVFSAGCVLFFMILKQRPFCDPDLATAVNSALTRKINLDQFVELQDSHALKELLGALMERSPLQRPDANAALGYSFLQAALAPHPPPTDPTSRANQRKQAFAKMMTTGDKQAPPSDAKLEVPQDEGLRQEMSLRSFEGTPPDPSGTTWQSCFSNSAVRSEPLVFRRRYVVVSGTTKSSLQLKPVRQLLDVLDLSHTIWQTLELSECEQVPLEVPDDSEPYSPSAFDAQPPSNALLNSEPARPGPERMVTGQIRSFVRQTSGGKKFRIDSVGGGMTTEMGEHARGQMSWWAHSQQPPVIGGKAADQVNRDLFGTCHFTQERTEDGRRRRLVRKATLGEGQEGQPQEEDFDDTASWQSWRSGVMSSASRRSSRGRSGSVMSLVSNASAVAMRELLAASDDEAHPHDNDDDYAIGPPAGRTLSGRSVGGPPVMHRLSIPGAGDHPPKRPMLTPSPPQTAREPRDERGDRDWGTCVFGKEPPTTRSSWTWPGAQISRGVKPMVQQLAASMASEASMAGVGKTPSAVGMQAACTEIS